MRGLVERLGSSTKMPLDISMERVMELMGWDKKARGGGGRFVLLEGVRKWRVVGDVRDEEIQLAIEALGMGD